MTFLSFIKLNLFLFGIDYDQKFAGYPKTTLILKFWKLLNPLLMIIGSIQLWIFFMQLSEDSTVLEIIIVVFALLFVAKSFAGYLTLVTTWTSLLKLMQNIEKVYLKVAKSDQTIENEQNVKSAYSFSLKMFVMIFSSVVIHFVGNLVKVVIAVVTDSHPGNLSIMNLWFPDFLKDSWLFVAVYDPLIMLLLCLSNLIVPQLVFITSAYLAASFDKLGDKVKDVIEGTENRSFLETKRKLAECVDLHSDLIELADESNRLYGLFNLTFLGLISLGFCVIGIMIMVSKYF